MPRPAPHLVPAVVVVAGVCLAASPARAFEIVLTPGSTLPSNPAAVGAFNRAASLWTSRIADPVTVNITANFGPVDGGIGQASSVILSGSYASVRDAMVLDAANDPDDAIVASLPLSFTATLPVTRTLSGNVRTTKANLKALGYANLDLLHGASDATLKFSDTFAFDYDNTDGVAAGSVDFETLVAHELGHALGFFSNVDSINGTGFGPTTPTALDLFRFGNDPARSPANAFEFSTFARSHMPGADAVFSDTVNDAWRLSTGQVHPDFPGTDGRQASHWKDDTLTGVYVGILDPSITAGRTFLPTLADYRALDLIGYDIVVPEPGASVTLPLAAMLLARRRRK